MYTVLIMWVVVVVYLFYIARQTGSSAQYYGSDELICDMWHGVTQTQACTTLRCTTRGCVMSRAKIKKKVVRANRVPAVCKAYVSEVYFSPKNRHNKNRISARQSRRFHSTCSSTFRSSTPVEVFFLDHFSHVKFRGSAKCIIKQRNRERARARGHLFLMNEL